MEIKSSMLHIILVYTYFGAKIVNIRIILKDNSHGFRSQLIKNWYYNLSLLLDFFLYFDFL